MRESSELQRRGQPSGNSGGISSGSASSIFTTPLPTPSRKRWSLEASDRALAYRMLAPAAIVLLGLQVYPLMYSLWLSFNRFDIISPPVFIGLTNYANLLSDTAFRDALRATFTFAIPAFALEVSIGFGLALLLNQDIRARGIFRTLMTMPLMLTPVVMGINFRLMLNYDFGVINWLIGLFGVGKVNWLADPTLAMVVLIAVDVWNEVPFSLLVLSAGLSSLPEEVMEAAQVDGANWWRKLWHVTIPLLKPLFLVVALFRSYNLIRMYDLVFALTGGGPGHATETLSYHIVRRMVLGWQVGYASAISYVLFGISLVIAVALIRASVRTEEVP